MAANAPEMGGSIGDANGANMKTAPSSGSSAGGGNNGWAAMGFVGSRLSGLSGTATRYNPLEGVGSLADGVNKTRKSATRFFACSEFSKPKNRGELVDRLRSNTYQFKLMYGILYLGVLVYYLLTSMSLVFGVVLIAGSWTYFFAITNADTPMTIGGHTLGRKEKTFCCIVGSLLVAVFTGIFSTLLWVLAVGSILTVAHASFRKKLESDPLFELEQEVDGAGSFA